MEKKLENLQDKLPPFSLLQAKEIIKNDLGNECYDSIINLSEPVAAASIAQVHKAQINDNGVLKDVAIKILDRDETAEKMQSTSDALQMLKDKYAKQGK